MFEKAETVPVQDEAPKVIAEAQKKITRHLSDAENWVPY
jgi:hypothetical protein